MELILNSSPISLKKAFSSSRDLVGLEDSSDTNLMLQMSMKISMVVEMISMLRLTSSELNEVNKQFKCFTYDN